jgi:undecaprenyl pyrophosphate synthase
MAWKAIECEINGAKISGHKKGSLFSVPFNEGIEIGNEINVGSAKFEVTYVVNVGGRNEICNLTTKEIKGGKPKTRRVDDKSGE